MIHEWSRARAIRSSSALRARGVGVKYDVYEDEGHGFTRRANELKAIGDTAEFLISHLNA